MGRCVGITVYKGWSRVGARTGTLKNSAKCLWRWEPDRSSNFFFSPPAHLCAVTYMTEISLIVTLNNKFNSTVGIGAFVIDRVSSFSFSLCIRSKLLRSIFQACHIFLDLTFEFPLVLSRSYVQYFKSTTCNYEIITFCLWQYFNNTETFSAISVWIWHLIFLYCIPFNPLVGRMVLHNPRGKENKYVTKCRYRIMHVLCIGHKWNNIRNYLL